MYSRDDLPTVVDIERRGLIREKQRAALTSVLAGLFLTVIKGVVGIMSGSLGLLAEAAHSALDFGAAAITLLAVRTSWQPPDQEHHFGHGKIENLSALAEAALLALTSVWILSEAMERFMSRGPEIDPSLWTFAVMGMSIVIDVVRSRDLRRVAEKSRSQAIEADALHFSTDIASSMVVIVGLGCVLVAQRYGIAVLTLADPIAASIVAIIVLVLSWNLGKRATDVLLDRAPAGLAEKVRAALAGFAGIESIPEVRLRQGGDQLFVEVDMALKPGLPLAEGDRLAVSARSRIAEILGKNATATIQLRATAGLDASLRERVATAVAMEGVQAHNITIRKDDSGSHADLHLELPAEMSLGEGHAVADRVEARVQHEIPELRRVDIHLELHDGEPSHAADLDESTRRQLEAKVMDIASGVVGQGAIHDVMLSKTSDGLYLSCHCLLGADVSLASAHAVTDRLEREFRLAMPQLSRVAVHAEPKGSRS
jgi:cation diffusion facilitator family transporter